jgi:hypothetical protein
MLLFHELLYTIPVSFGFLVVFFNFAPRRKIRRPYRSEALV